MRIQGESLRKLMHQTAEAIRSKDMVPCSPGAIVNDQPLLCAGAALVYEAARNRISTQELARLARDMIALGRVHILRMAQAFDLDADLVKSVVLKNDAYGDSDRRERMFEFLSARSPS
jgi:hypothetical protein